MSTYFMRLLYKRGISPVSALGWGSPGELQARYVADRKEASIYLSRLGDADKIRKKPDKQLQIFSEQKPEDAYRTWQTHRLINIGHYSYETNQGEHHYFIWLDLLGFIVSRTAESYDMISRMSERISRLKPSCLLFSPNEDSQALVRMLIQNAQENKRQGFPDIGRIWPVTIGESSVYVGPTEMDSFLSSMPISIPRTDPVVFVDNAMVTGRTNRQLRSVLSQMGFSDVHSFVVLDRVQPNIELQRQDSDSLKHFSWWSLAVPSTGSRSTCSICRGIGILHMLKKEAGSEAIRDVLSQWIGLWSKAHHFAQFQNKLERNWLPGDAHKKLGSTKEKNVKLHSSDALCTWAFDMMSRLDYFAYLFSNAQSVFSQCLTEVLAGMIFMFWERLDAFDRRRAISLLVDQVWIELRESARSLAAVAIASLQRIDIENISAIIMRKIRSEGIPNFYVGAFVHMVSRIAAGFSLGEPELIDMCLQRSPEMEEKIPREQHTRTVSILRNLSSAYRKEDVAWKAIREIGLPGRGLQHHPIYDMLSKLAETQLPSTHHREQLYHVMLCFEPIIAIAKLRADLFTKEKVFDELKELFADLQLLWSQRPRRKSDYKKLGDVEFLRKTCREAHDFLGNNIHGKTHIRRILGIEYIHYLPFRVRQIIQSGCQKADRGELGGWSADQFFVDCEMSLPETRLLSLSREADRTTEDSLLEELQKKDIVFIRDSELRTVLRDFLMDVEHPKKIGRSILDRAFMKVSFSQEADNLERPHYSVHFENAAEESVLEKSEGRSWSHARSIVETYGGRISDSYNRETGVFKRSLSFPCIRAADRLEKSYEC